jgi:hypothetical protein
LLCAALQAYRELNDELWRAGWFEPVLAAHVRILAVAWLLLAACVGLLAAARSDAAAAAAGGWARGALTVAAGACLSQFWQQVSCRRAHCRAVKKLVVRPARGAAQCRAQAPCSKTSSCQNRLAVLQLSSHLPRPTQRRL